MEIKSGSLTEVIRYIEEREKNLSRYSDKLRESVEKIFAQFGDSGLCRVCGKAKREHRKYKLRNCPSVVEYYDELPKEIQGMKPKIVTNDFDTGRWGNPETHEIYVVETKIDHEFQPKIFVSIDVDDTEIFYKEYSEVGDVEYKYSLGIREHELRIVEYSENWECPKLPNDVSRKILKELVKSGRIIKFAKIIAEEVKKVEDEYKEVSEMAEKLSSIF